MFRPLKLPPELLNRIRTLLNCLQSFKITVRPLKLLAGPLFYCKIAFKAFKSNSDPKNCRPCQEIAVMVLKLVSDPQNNCQNLRSFSLILFQHHFTILHTWPSNNFYVSPNIVHKMHTKAKFCGYTKHKSQEIYIS